MNLILDNISFSLGDRERIAVVGRNGAGKTTLLRVAAGRLETDGGEVHLGKGQDIGFLEQERRVNLDNTVWDEVFEELAPILKLQSRAEAMIVEAADIISAEPARAQTMFEEAESLSERFRRCDGYRAEAACGRVLSGMGFVQEDWRRQAFELSGGWQIRIGLARLLLRRPAFLLLDEPTNHLDLETRTWLLHELRDYPGGIAIISHDQDFLDRLVSRTVEVSRANIEEYSGGYTAYLKQRALRIEQLTAQAKHREEERARIQLFINRFRAKATKAVQVQSRVKQLAKLPPIEVPERLSEVHLEFPDPPPSGDPMMQLNDVGKSYGDLDVFRDLRASVYSGDRILLVGPNGAGKSTLLKMMAGKLAPDSGGLQLGPGCRVAWFAQDQAEALNPEDTVLQATMAIDPLLTRQRARTILGSFLFSGDDVDKPCGVLSGGEKSRVALVRILLRRANLLLLDEPTNHLDIPTKDALRRALADYKGAIVFVTHDRFFANGLAERVWEVGATTVASHLGNLDDFLWDRAIELGLVARRAPGEAAPDAWLLGGLPVASGSAATAGVGEGGGKLARSGEAIGAETAPRGNASASDSWKDRKRKKQVRSKAERELKDLPAKIEGLEAEVAELDVYLTDPVLAADWEGLFKLQKKRRKASDELEVLYARWQELESLIEGA
jgi:ATP-binding cassette subfamily F protein 3